MFDNVEFRSPITKKEEHKPDVLQTLAGLAMFGIGVFGAYKVIDNDMKLNKARAEENARNLIYDLNNN